MAGKFHYHWTPTEEGMPNYIKEKHYLSFENGAIDGYMRSRCTTIIPLVDCFYCRQEMKRKGIIKQ